MNTRNLAATLQANISILFIACMFFPFVAPNLSLYPEEFVLTGHDLVYNIDILLLFHIINIFIQAHGCYRLFSAMLSIVSLVILGISYYDFEYIILSRFQHTSVCDFELKFGFYLAIVLLLALLIVPTLIVRWGNKRTVSIYDNTAKDSADDI